MLLYRVFGCSTYVWQPPANWKDKLTPKSEIMTYISITDGYKSFTFMNSKNSIIRAATVLFDESYFPLCKSQKMPGIQHFPDLSHCYMGSDSDDNDDDISPERDD